MRTPNMSHVGIHKLLVAIKDAHSNPSLSSSIMNTNKAMKNKSKTHKNGGQNVGPKPVPAGGRASGGSRHVKTSLMDIASSTLEKIEQGSYNMKDKTYNLSKAVQEMKEKTLFFAENSGLSKWRQSPTSVSNSDDSEVTKRSVVRTTISECSTLAGSRALYEELNAGYGSKERIGVLNFASAKNPGGGFLTGAQAQVRIQHIRRFMRFAFCLL